MTSGAEIARLRERSVDLRALGETRLVSLEDGPARGQRLLLMRNADGLECEVALDRGGDVPALRWRGLNLGWCGPVGAAASPHPDAEEGFGLLRGLDGFLVTCGLDHFGMPAKGPADAFLYPRRSTLHYPLHGRISGLGATLRGHGLERATQAAKLWCELEVRQVALFGEVLRLHRRIEMPLFEPCLRIIDSVTNDGFRPTRHGLLYHCNLGFPLLDEGTRLTGAFAPELLDNLERMPPRPSPESIERFDVQASIRGGEGFSTVGVNTPSARGVLGFDMTYSAKTLPRLGLWQAWQSGIYALGIEPHSHLDEPGEASARSTLMPGETRDYRLEFKVTDGTR